MKPQDRNFILVVVAIVLALPVLGLTTPTADTASTFESAAVPLPSPVDPLTQKLIDRERRENGITVGEPRVYDDAQLHQRLKELEARLASLQPIEQKPITDKLGSVTGASQQISSTAINVQGPSVPGVTTTTKLPTETTTQNTAAGSTSSSLQTVSNLATEDVQTVRPAFAPPTATAPPPTTTMPSAFSVSSSDMLNEMTQLNAEINGLRLMLAGDLSSHYIRGGATGNEMTKLTTTLGFNIAVKPDERYKDALAVVEVEVENVCSTLSPEPPAITAILPREKTYNVAAISDKSTSIGGGVATQILGVSGSFLRGHKTHYIVQDQDTVALTFSPDHQPTDTCRPGGAGIPKKRVGFLWQFRPVLGRRVVRIADKTTFVRLALPVLPDAADGSIGSVTIRSYWRRYDRKTGIQKGIIPGSVREHVADANPFDIPRYKLAVSPAAFNYRDSIEYLGAGQVLVKLAGRYLPGTTVRLGSVVLSEGERFKHRYSGIVFTASVQELATRKLFLVGHDGTEVKLELPPPTIVPAPGAFAVPPCGATRQPPGDLPLINNYTAQLRVSGVPTVTTIDETNSQLKLDFVIELTTVSAAGVTTITTVTPTAGDEFPTLALQVGGRVFSLLDGSLRRLGPNTIAALVPSTQLSTASELALQVILPGDKCRTIYPLPAFEPPSQNERLELLEQGADKSKFLLFGSRLNGIMVIAPAGVAPQNIGTPPDPDRLLLVELTAAQLKAYKQLLAQRPGERPFRIAIPSLEAAKKPDPPKAKERLTVGGDEATVVGEGLKEVARVLFGKRVLTAEHVEIADDGKSVRLKGLRDLGLTAVPKEQALVFEFKSGAKVAVTIEVVNSKIEIVTK